MSVTSGSLQSRPEIGGGSRVNVLFESLFSTVFSGLASLAVTVNAYAESSRPVRQIFVLSLLIGSHLLVKRKLWISRELKIYLAFLAYMCLSLLWTENVALAIPTLNLAVSFALILMLFSALVMYHKRRAVVNGLLGGFLIGAGLYTLTKHFPFAYPDDFSYNTMAGMYLFGLFCTILFGWFTRRTLIPVALSLVLFFLIAATTSIKTNVGIALGVGAAAVLYFRHFIRAMRRMLLMFIAFGVLIGFAINSNDALVERINAGATRVSMGVGILLAREDVEGGTAFDERRQWKDDGIKGWLRSPVFGNGVEAFRADYGVTSHSTPVDLLYNAGLVGFAFFYAILASIALRLRRATDASVASFRAFLAGLWVCYGFMSLSEPMYYDAFLAVFIAASTAFLSLRSSTPN
jgi:hypothetical protein